MVDLETNTTTFTSALNTVLQASNGSMNELQAINQAILTGEGIDQIIENFADENPEFAQALKNNKNNLKKPDVELSLLMESEIEIPKELAEKLELAGTKTTDATIKVSIGSFTQAALKESLKENENTFGLGNLNSETLDLLCLLLCQDSKSQLIETLKQTLKSKVAERQNLSNEYLEKTTNIAKEEVEALKAAEKAKILSIISSVLSAVLAVVITVVSVAATIATCGTGAPAIIAAAVSVTLSIMSTVSSVAASGCTIAGACTDDQDKKDKLNSASFGLGIASAVLGILGCGADIAGSIASSAAKAGTSAAKAAAKAAGSSISKETSKAIGKAAAEAGEAVIKDATKKMAKETLKKIVKNAAKSAAKEAIKEAGKEITEEAAETIAEEAAKAVTKQLIKNSLQKTLEITNDILTAGNSIIQGATEIATGVLNIKAANKQRSLDEIKIDMAKLDQEIETLVAFIDALTQGIQNFIEDFLKNEQEAAETLQAKGDIELQLAQKNA